MRRIEIETPDPSARVDALHREWTLWYEHGRDKGLNLDAAVAVHLARATVDAALNADQRGRALTSLGNALTTLGEREPASRSLEEAIVAYRAALVVRSRDDVPRKWAGV